MKNTYTTPQLTVHGNVEEITQAFGRSPAQDTWVAGQSNVDQGGHSTGSIDGVIVPQ
ncbi:MAG: lasso peptide [Geitlerinemataceae cyanobacterium]